MGSIQDIIELQKIDSQLQELEELLGDLPVQVDELTTEEATLRSSVEKGKARLKEIEVSLSKADLRVSELKGKINKLKDQLFLVTSNKQYDALMQEIDFLKEKLDRVETEDIELLEEKSRLEEQVKSQELNLTTLSANLTKQLGNLQECMTESADLKEKLEQQRKEKIAVIDVTLLARYDRIRHARDGLAVVPLTGNACSGCGSMVPPQTVADVKARRRICTCDVCNRFLYWEK
ncbi:MAG: hypothetical protein GXO92_05065 [FCB group bacterium]|nr:hypothetical protein [FCB group bacterium]